MTHVTSWESCGQATAGSPSAGRPLRPRRPCEGDREHVGILGDSGVLAPSCRLEQGLAAGAGLPSGDRLLRWPVASSQDDAGLPGAVQGCHPGGRA